MFTARFGLFVVTAALQAAASLTQLSAPILGGEEAAAAQFPYAVSLRLEGVHACGASIIDERHILTAAHCVVEQDTEPSTHSRSLDRLSVRVGSSNQFAGGQILRVERVHIHDGYADYRQDIAVLRLATDLAMSNRIAAIALASRAAEEPPVGAAVTVAGWGKQDSDTATYKLHHRTFAVADEAVCLDAFPEKDASTLCLLHAPKVGSCTGDAGNGAVYGGKLVAVSNFIVGACGSRYPDVFIKVAPYVPWIRSVTEGRERATQDRMKY